VFQEVDGKHIQIQLTGFMEKNTIKFMKELWSLLISAQQNASGVPQQFLDAKEAEIQQRKVCIKHITVLILHLYVILRACCFEVTHKLEFTYKTVNQSCLPGRTLIPSGNINLLYE
jgi:hypothetical protein